MQEEYFKAEPSQVVVTDLMRVTFPFRRHYIIHESPNAKQVVEKYPFLRNVTYVSKLHDYLIESGK